MTRSVSMALASLAVVLGFIGGTFSTSASQAVDVRIEARQIADSRIEFVLLIDEQRLLPQQRYFPVGATVDRWLVSSPVLIEAILLGEQSDDDTTVRIVARRLGSGKVEFGLQVNLAGQWSDTLLPELRFFPVEARSGRWLRSSRIDLLRAQVYKGFGDEHVECIRILDALVPSHAGDYVDASRLHVRIEPSTIGVKRALERSPTERQRYLANPDRFRLNEAISLLAAFGATFNSSFVSAEGTVCPGLFAETMRYRNPVVAEWHIGLHQLNQLLSAIDVLMTIGPDLNAEAALSIWP